MIAILGCALLATGLTSWACRRNPAWWLSFADECDRDAQIARETADQYERWHGQEIAKELRALAFGMDQRAARCRRRAASLQERRST